MATLRASNTTDQVGVRASESLPHLKEPFIFLNDGERGGVGSRFARVTGKSVRVGGKDRGGHRERE